MVAPGELPKSDRGWLFRRLFRATTVLRTESIAEGYRVITLAGERLRGVAWAPGQKLQIALEGSSSRTYTPMGWDSAQGETRFLAFVHSAGPGALWASRVKPGDECFFMGPRRSLDLGGLGHHVFLFGDETSMGLAVALGRTLRPSDHVESVFEVSSAPASQRAWHSLGQGEAEFIQRRDDDGHLEEVGSQARRIFNSGRPTGFVLTGKSTSIQYVLRRLKDLGAKTSELRVKAYWAPGRAGLD